MLHLTGLHDARVDVTQRRGITIAGEYVSPCSERRSAELSDTLRNVTLLYNYVIFDDHRFLMLAHFSACVKKAASDRCVIVLHIVETI